MDTFAVHFEPVTVFYERHGLAATVYRTYGQYATYYVTLSRMYRDRKGRLQRTCEYPNDSLPWLAKLAERAADYVASKEDDLSESRPVSLN